MINIFYDFYMFIWRHLFFKVYVVKNNALLFPIHSIQQRPDLLNQRQLLPILLPTSLFQLLRILSSRLALTILMILISFQIHQKLHIDELHCHHR